MSLSKRQVQYILDKFDAGVPTHRIPMGFQSAHLPSADIDTIEQCLRENGRLQSNHYQAGYYAAIWANQPPPPPGGVGRGSNNPPGPANQRPSTATPNPSAQTSAAATNNLVVGGGAAANLGPPSNGTLRRTTSSFPPTDLGNRRR